MIHRKKGRFWKMVIEKGTKRKVIKQNKGSNDAM